MIILVELQILYTRSTHQIEFCPFPCPATLIVSSFPLKLFTYYLSLSSYHWNIQIPFPNAKTPICPCSALNKSRFKAATMFHYLLFFVMLAKLSADILDKLDVFVLEIEELQVPTPLWWEYIWCMSILTTFVGLWATKRNRVRTMQQYIAGIVVFGVIPLVFCLIYYFNDVIGYLSYDDEDVDIEDSDIVFWRVCE